MYMLMFPLRRRYHHNLQSTDGLTILANWLERLVALRDVSCRQSWHLSTPSHPRVPPEWPYCQQAQCGLWFTVQWSIADLLTSSHPQMSASHLLGLQVCANGPSLSAFVQEQWLCWFYRNLIIQKWRKTSKAIVLLVKQIYGSSSQ